jgi:carbonic anhydrase
MAARHLGEWPFSCHAGDGSKMEAPITRRQLLVTAGLGFANFISPPRMGVCDDSTPATTSQLAIARLKLGNKRFVDGKPKHYRENRAWRKSLVSAQNPFAVILGCADSRVPTELVFDQGFGDLFVIRNAGNVVMADVMGSVEYAALHLKTRLVVVLGHEGCGAVTAALKSREERAKEPPELQQVLRLIDPAIANLDPRAKDVVQEAVEANVRWTVKNSVRIQKQRNHPHASSLAFVGAVYELKSGKVRFLE